jgi:plasmid maintenance system antidote protein VapI
MLRSSTAKMCKDKWGAPVGSQKAEINALINGKPITMPQIVAKLKLPEGRYNHVNELIARRLVVNTPEGYVPASPGPMSQGLRDSIGKSGKALSDLERTTGVNRASIMRFMRGERSLRLDMADRLAVYFGLELRKRGKR